MSVNGGSKVVPRSQVKLVILVRFLNEGRESIHPNEIVFGVLLISHSKADEDLTTRPYTSV